VAHGYALRSTGDCELIPKRAPFDLSSRTINPQNNQSGFPVVVVVEPPHVGISVMAARHQQIRFGTPVDAADLARVLNQ